MIYPFDIEVITLLRHRGLLCNYNISAVISPNGWGTNFMDASIVYNGSYVGMKIENNFEKLLHTVDAVMFSQSHILLNLKKSVYPKILMAIWSYVNILDTKSQTLNCKSS